MYKIIFFLLISVILFNNNILSAQEIVDNLNETNINGQIHEAESGSSVCTDSAHNNLHTIDQRLAPFATYLEKDGYQMQPVHAKFDAKIPVDAISVITFGNYHYTLMPDTAWQFSAKTPQKSVEGWSQGAIKLYGKGKLAVFGEAAMFTSQTIQNQNLKVGFIDPSAPQNAGFLLNIIHWLHPELN